VGFPSFHHNNFAYNAFLAKATHQTKYIDFRVWLQGEFYERARKNPRYSLRAFSRLLDMNAASVSQILSGKRKVSTKLISRICDDLAVAPDLRQLLLKSMIQHRVAISKEQRAYTQIAMDSFAVMADWYHYAILELTFNSDFKIEPAWLAAQLGIRATEAKIAIERLLRLGLLVEKNGKLRKATAATTNGVGNMTSPALKVLQRQLLSKALEAIDLISQEEKDITSMTMSIDPALLPEARTRIKKFRRELCALLESGERSRVYNLGIQLFPLQKTKSPIKE
jgi:uncharacterized protein (TIGR02147 family)